MRILNERVNEQLKRTNNMKEFCKYLGVSAAIFALLCMTGFDCPECNYAAQFTALGISVLVAVICVLINANE